MEIFYADIATKLMTVLWPLIRIGSALMTAPIFTAESANTRVRLILTITLTVLIFPLQDWPIIDPISPAGMGALLNEIAIGTLMGFSLQIVSSAVMLAGQAISATMGLSMATFLDPTSGQVPVLSEFFTIMSTLIFLGMGGHILFISLLADSFNLLPVGQSIIGLKSINALLAWSSMLFIGALMISIPVITALLLINVGLGVVTRAAPSLNIFSVGLPATIATGFIMLIFSMSGIGTRLVWLWQQSFEKLHTILGVH
jgi:flagellar biosynthetic protein FliR